MILSIQSVLLRAQVPVQLPAGAAAQYQVPQPPVEVSSPDAITATAGFDPAIIRTGEKTFYRVNVDATESSFSLPSTLAVSPGLQCRLVAHGQLTRLDGNKFGPLTSYVFEVQTTVPGRFTVSNFTVNVDGQAVEIPAAGVDVVADNSHTAPTRRLILELSATNLFIGQPFRARVIWPVDQRNQVEALREVQFNGGSWMMDKLWMRQWIEPVNDGGQLKPAFIYETVLTPIALGPLPISAQAFSAGLDFGGPVTISGPVTVSGGQPKYVLRVSRAVDLNVRPLPAGNALPGFTGAMGKFLMEPPQLSTNRIRVGEPLQLKLDFHGESDLARFTPPELPRSRDWQIIAGKPPGTGFTLVPLTEEVRETPVIPFSSFDPATGRYEDLTIPALPVTVLGEGLPVELRGYDEGKDVAPLKLGTLADVPGRPVASLKPLQLRGWFVVLQFLPLVGFLALWQWDQRRRFLAAHPEIVRRRQAKRALRREKIKLRSAVAAGDANAFVRHAADAMRVAVAPHFPAQPQALVGGDVLSQFAGAERSGPVDETVRQIFSASDTRFALTPEVQAGLLALESNVEAVLQQLEEKL